MIGRWMAVRNTQVAAAKASHSYTPRALQFRLAMKPGTPTHSYTGRTPVVSTSSGGGVSPNPLLLPLANFTSLTAANYNATVNMSAYTALNVPSRAPGYTYTDPVTGVTVVKLTTATAPISGTATWMCGVDYGAGGARIGLPTAGVYPIAVLRNPNGAHDYHIIDFNINTRAVSYRCPLTAMATREIGRAFSAVTPNIIYGFGTNETTLRKFNISSGAAVEVTGGVWPRVWR
jgi:hypothetical protein